VKWVIYSLMRRGSERVPNKLLQKIWTPVGFVTLMEWNAVRMRKWSEELDIPYYLGVSWEDVEMLGPEFNTFERNPESLESEDVLTIHGCVPPRFDIYDMALHVNACCPFLTRKTIQNFMAGLEGEYTDTAGGSVWPSREECGFAYSKTARLFPPHMQQLQQNTKIDPVFYVQDRTMVAFPATDIGRRELPVAGHVPIGPWRPELIDIDRPGDIGLVAAYAAYQWHMYSEPTTGAEYANDCQPVAASGRWGGYP